MLAQARTRIVRYTTEQAVSGPDLLLVDELGVDAGDLVGRYEAWIAAR